ncbi:potassium voltage-gated channel protein Shaw-like [Pecten maximus]|uniref:potassium voltage-gated channel protein Shaw-like n=1 Tax=Pecten maximus TaxID=6579 RepID=UPI0014580244|nr:potassium voltage-gated channel protein Shaw-like [Pecten maximus]
MYIQLENMDAPHQVFELNISGKLFEVTADVLARFPKSRLGKLAVESSVSLTQGTGTKKTLSFSRPSPPFDDILAYYQTGELHMPVNICPKAYKRELDFWELDPDDMQYCCRFKYLAFFDEFETISTFQASIEKTNFTSAVSNSSLSTIGRFRARVWSVIEHEESTVISKIVMMFLVLCVATSILNLSLGTVDSFKQRISLTSLHSHLTDLVEQEGGDYDDIIDILEVTLCGDNWECVLDEFDAYLDEAEENNITSIGHEHMNFDPKELKRTLEKFKSLTQHKTRHYAMIVIDFVLLVIFFIELIVRLCACPSLRRYFLSPLNDIDILILVTAIIDVVIENWYAKFRYSDKGIRILYYLQMLRVLRILRFVNKVPSIQVLSYTVRTNVTDLVVLFLYVLVGVIIISNFAYFAEDKSTFTDMPESWWWGVITMTTVGYGDVVPKTALGKIMGCICALCGVLSLSITVPVFVNTFISLYQISNIYNRYLKPKQNQVSPTTRTMTSRVTMQPDTGPDSISLDGTPVTTEKVT